ncbi:hypothetical protein J2Y58_003882 [Sphingomonas sp. BE138]|uniref:hypothetical protein n=1 Tax=Sphingomonas sp. BE138 TaxID=2817845 RepID=UPI0028620FA6|nr:hypothetical protein [Sphingomonas sp. BE138]MDR6790499.1 hypothetical protein [Sphingomonas sp. BE138]
MCIDPNIEPVAFALDTKLCHLFPSLGDIHREEIALDLARTAIFMATAMAMDMAQEYRNGGPLPVMPVLPKPATPATEAELAPSPGTVMLTPAVPPRVTVLAKSTDVTVQGDGPAGFTFGIDNRTDRLIDIRHAGKCWCITPDDEATDVVSRAIGALAAAHADIGTALAPIGVA